uniref:Brother of CDO n=1 Tax=Anabas testudineus TaxID=64144 RepID=A0A3Q1I4C9_ANATE
MSGKRDWTPWMKKRRAPVLCALGAVLLCCLQSGVPVFLEEPMSVVQKLGGSVNLRCSVRPASANISWHLNGQELIDGDLGVVLRPTSLFIPTLSNVTVGRYQCVASTNAGALASVPANVTAAKLRDFEPDDQQEIEVDEGNTAVIECHLPESQPKAQVRYSVKQEWLETSKGNYLIMPSGNLQIANATQDDEGPYKCAAYNPITQEVKTSISADRLRIRRSMSEAARIIYPPASRSIMVTKGQRLVLECVASGIPTPHVTWAKDGQDLRLHNNTRFLLSNLLIDAVVEGDSGTYVCQADNGIGSANSATVLYDVQVFEPPQVTVELQQQEVLHGETVRFICQVRGKPTPSVMWFHNARPLAPSNRHRVSSRVLRVSNVGPQDEGLYQCMAENGVGSSQASARLITVSTGKLDSFVKLPSSYRPLSPDKVLREQPPVKPGATGAMLPLDCSELPGQILPADAPIILSQPRTGKADYYELTWRPRHERGARVLEYMIKYRKVGDPLAEWTSSSISGSLYKLTLAKLQPDSLYEVEMAAKNCAGLGQPAMMTFRTGKGTLCDHKPSFSVINSDMIHSTPEAPDKPTVSTATETSAYVTWIPRGNRGFPIQSFRVEYKKVKKAGEDWVTAVENIPPSRLSVEITGLEKGTSYKFRVVAVNVIGSSPPSAPSKAYTVVGGRTHERPVDGPYITYNEAINDTTIILKWTYTPVNNTPIYGFYIYYRPTDSDNDSDYKKDVVEGDRYWHSITDLQPETAYDIKMQSFNEKGESEFGNVVILETKARPNRPNQRPAPSQTPDHGLEHTSGLVPRPSDLPYLIVGIVLGAFVFIIVAFIPFCLWRAWAKQKQTSDLCFPPVATPVSSCQYTMVPLQGLALVGHCPLDGHMTTPHGVYPANGDYTPNGKPHHATQCLPGMQQVIKKIQFVKKAYIDKKTRCFCVGVERMIYVPFVFTG